MMEKAPEVISALETLADFLEKMGVPGLLALFVIGPAMIIVALFALDYMRHRHAIQDTEQRRKEAEEYRNQLRVLQESHRAEMGIILNDLGKKHAEVVQFYKDNVELVKITQRLAHDMRDIVTNNTRAMEHLASAVNNNFYCPAVRDVIGKK